MASTRGFTLFETLVATSILITALTGIAQLFVLSTHLTRGAAASGSALAAAHDKLESLRGLTFGYDEAGASMTSAALQPSPSSSLDEDVDGYVDWVDGTGRAGGEPGAAAFARRWKISPVAGPPPDAIAIEVCVFTMPVHAADARAAEACLSALRSRQP